MRTPAPNGATGLARESTRTAARDGRSARGRGLALPFLLLLGGALLAGVMFAGAAPNNPPTVVSSGGTLGYTEDAGGVIFDGGFLVDDLDGDPIQGATVQFTAGFVTGEDQLASGGGGGVSASWDSGSGILTLSGAAPASTYQIVLRQITYENLSQSPSTATRSVSTSVTDGIDPSAATSRDIAVTSVHDNPQLTLTSGSLSYIESSGPIAIDVGALAVDDEDDLVAANLQITGGYVSGEDTLAFGGLGAISGSWNAGSGTLTLTGSGTTAEWQTALRAVTYENSSNNPTTAPRTVTATISDATITSGAATRVIAITSVNDPPSAGGDVTVTAPGGGAVSIAEDTPAPGAANIRVSPATLSDVEGPSPTSIRIMAVTGGTLAQGDGSVIGLGSGGSILSLAAGGVDLRFTPTANRDTDASFTYVVVDAANPGINSSASTATIPVTPVNDEPILGVSGGSASFVENGGPVVVDGGATVADIDNIDLASATAQITGGYVNGEDVLAATVGGGIAVNWNAGTGTLTLSGSASLAAYEFALRSITFDNPSENPAVSARTVSFTLDDGGAPSATLTRGVTITPANDAPTVVAGGSASYVENAAPALVDASVVVGDVDSATLASATVQITGGHVPSEDQLAAVGSGGVTVTWAAGSGTLSLAGTATVSTYETILRSATYANTSDAPDTTTRTISFTVHDGALPSTPSTASVSIVASNDAPSLAGGGGSVTYTENDPATVVDSDLTITDLDDTSFEGATIRVSVNLSNTEDVLGFTNQSGISSSWSPGTGTLTLSGTATLADYETALESISYANLSDDPTTATRTIEFVLDDGDDPSNAVTDDVVLVAVNDVATIAIDPSPIAYVENDPTTPLDAALTVEDVDDPQIDEVTIDAASGWRSGEDTLIVTPSGGITATYDPIDGSVVLVGPASTAAFETVLRSVRFHNADEALTAGTRVFDLHADDGTAIGPPSTRSIIVTAVNDAPVALNDSGEILQGAWIAVDVLGNDTDVDGGYLRVGGWVSPPDATVTKTNGKLKVVPDDDFVGALDVLYDAADGRGGTDTARLRVRVRAAADGSVSLGDLPNPVMAGNQLSEVVKVRNWGPGILEAPTVTVRVPGARLAGYTAPHGIACRASGEQYVCDLGDLDEGEQIEILVRAIPNAAGLITASATLRHRSVDPDDGDLEDRETTTVLARPGTVTPPGGGWTPPSSTQPPSTSPPTTEPMPATPTTTSGPTSTTLPASTTSFEDTIDDVPTTAAPDVDDATTTTAALHGGEVPTAPTGAATTGSGSSGGSGSPVSSLLVVVMFAAAAGVFWWQRRRALV